jgi:hypothetical protein
LLTISCVIYIYIYIYLRVNVAFSLEHGTARRRADDVLSAATGNTVCSVVLSPTGKRDGEKEGERERKEKGKSSVCKGSQVDAER